MKNSQENSWKAVVLNVALDQDTFGTIRIKIKAGEPRNVSKLQTPLWLIRSIPEPDLFYELEHCRGGHDIQLFFNLLQTLHLIILSHP